MANPNPTANPQNVTYLPMTATDTTVKLNRLVILDTTTGNEGNVVAASAATTRLFGVCLNIEGVSNAQSAAGDHVSIATDGVQLVEAGAAVSLGDLITSDSAGRGVTASSGNFIIGEALAAAGGAGEFFAVRLFKGVQKAP